jgi:hypothetical protein
VERRKETLMKTGIGLITAIGMLVGGSAQAAVVQPGAPQLLEAHTGVTCVVPATFPVGGSPTRVYYMGASTGLMMKREGQPLQYITRGAINGGEQRSTGVYLANSYGVLYSPDGASLRYLAPAMRFLLVSPYGWVKDADGLWNLEENGTFTRSSLPVAPWRNVVGFAPSTNYLYGANLLWVGTASTGFYYQRGLYQAVFVNGRSYPTPGLWDHYRVTDVCGVTGGHYMVYSGMVLRYRDAYDPFAALYTDAGLPPDSYKLQSLKFGPNDIDAVAYAGRTLWFNLGAASPTSVFMPGVIRHVAVDPAWRQLIVSTSAGVYAIPYTESS